jgi:hypothetical protein
VGLPGVGHWDVPDHPFLVMQLTDYYSGTEFGLASFRASRLIVLSYTNVFRSLCQSKPVRKNR